MKKRTILQLSPKITSTLKNTLTYRTLREDLVMCIFFSHCNIYNHSRFSLSFS